MTYLQTSRKIIAWNVNHLAVLLLTRTRVVLALIFNLYESNDDSVPISNLQTKTAKLLYRAVGESSDLTELDNLR